MNKYINKAKELFKYFWHDPLFLSHWESPFYNHHRDNNRLSHRLAGHRKRKQYPYRGSLFMFIEDMYTGIMPFMLYKGEREKYPMRIEPHSRELERLISAGISGRDYSFLADSLCDFVRETAHVLHHDGVAFYEIVYKKSESGKIESFDLELVQPFYFFQLLGNYFQFVPWWEAKRSHIKVQIVKIPKEKILRIDFPKQLGGRRRINKILKRLSALSKESIPKFQMEAMGKNQNIGFDLNEFTKAKYLEIAGLTKNIGWNQRKYSDNYITEYYSMLRFLRERKAQSIVRDEIIMKLHQILNGRILNLGTRIIIENIFTVEDVKKQEKLLKDGNVAFIDIFNSLKI